MATTEDTNLGVSTAYLKSALDMCSQGIFILDALASRYYPNSIQITDAIGACYAVRNLIVTKIQNGETVGSEDKAKIARELGEITKCCNFLSGLSSDLASEIKKQISAIAADLSSVFNIDKDTVRNYSQTTNIMTGERTEIYRQVLAQRKKEEEEGEFLSMLQQRFSPETTRGEKLISEVYSRCGVISSISEYLSESNISLSQTLADHAIGIFREIGMLAEHISDPFVEKYFTHTTPAEFKTLCGKLKNPATYDSISTSLIVNLHQEILPIRQALWKHTGEETGKQNSVINNYDQVLDIQKRDIDRLKTESHPIIWGTGILIAVRLGLLEVWKPTWTGLLSLLMFIIPIVVLWRRDFESFSEDMEIGYPEQPDFWVTRTHLNDAIIENRKDAISKFHDAIENRKKDKRLAENLWFAIAPVVATLNAVSSAYGWI